MNRPPVGSRWSLPGSPLVGEVVDSDHPDGTIPMMLADADPEHLDPTPVQVPLTALDGLVRVDES